MKYTISWFVIMVLLLELLFVFSIYQTKLVNDFCDDRGMVAPKRDYNLKPSFKKEYIVCRTDCSEPICEVHYFKFNME